jgi:GNAT superfamily N-acetyltransferase
MDGGGTSIQTLSAGGIASDPMARIATDADCYAVLATIVDAFHRDPIWSWICPDPLRRREQHAEIFGLYVESVLPNRGVWMADAAASAVAVFTPPGRRELSEQAESRLESFLRRTLGAHAPAVLETLERFAAALPEGRPFYYLSFLGTRPAARGSGFGMGLLAELVELADREGQPIYLESTNPANNPGYARLGFEAQSRFSTPDDLHTVTTMWRDPEPRP